MSVEELKQKLNQVKEEMENNWLIDNWEDDNGGMEEFEVHNAYEKIDTFEEVLELLENIGDPLEIGQKLSL